jgi:hypothetical protein
MSTTEKAAAALKLLLEELREPAAAYLLEQGKRFRGLKKLVAEGMDDLGAGRVSEWNLQEFLRAAWKPHDRRPHGR